MKCLTLFILLLFINMRLFAQSIVGKVVDTEKQPIEFANVGVYALPDTVQLRNGTVTDSLGSFQIIEELPIGNYQIRVSFLGFKTGISNFHISEQNKNIELSFTLYPDAAMLNEFVVEGQRPAMKVDAGKLTYHIPSLLRHKPVTNAYEALKEIPGVMEQNGQITLLGTSGMTILLNGKKTSMTYSQLTTLLRSTPFSRVEDIEIMYSAPPELNVRGSAINIILKQVSDDKSESGFQGEISGEYQQKTYGRANTRANLHIIAKRTSIDMLYAYSHNNGYSKEELTADHLYQNNQHKVSHNSISKSKSNSHNIRVSAAHTFRNKDMAEISYTTILSNSNANQTAATDISKKIIDTKNYSEGSSQTHNMNLDYSAHFGLKVGVDYTFYKSRSAYSLTNSFQKPSTLIEKIESKSEQKVHRTFFYANQTHQLNKTWRLNYGVNYSIAQTVNKALSLKDVVSYNEGTFDTKQQEDIWNLFVGLSKTFSQKISAQASVAAEFYNSVEESNGKKNTLWDDMAWFPAFNISYRPSSNHVLQLALTSNKTYPPYWTLNPSIYHLSAYAVTFGNPYLRPMKEYTLGLTYIFKRKYVIRPYFTQIPDYYTQLPYQSADELRQEFVMQNFDFRRRAGLLTIVPFKIGNSISSRFIANGMYMREKDNSFYDIPFDRESYFGVFQLNTDINLSTKPNVKMNISGFYSTPNAIQGIYDLGWSANISGGITWTFHNEKAKLILRGEDILGTRTPVASIDYKNQKSTLTAFRDTRLISLSFIYRFGGFKEKERSGVDTSRFGM